MAGLVATTCEDCGCALQERPFYRVPHGGRCTECFAAQVTIDPFSLDVPEPTLPHACCGHATVRACVCAYAYDCPTHGASHVGTHD